MWGGIDARRAESYAKPAYLHVVLHITHLLPLLGDDSGDASGNARGNASGNAQWQYQRRWEHGR